MANKKYRNGQYESECFKKLPERAQEIWWQYCDIATRHQKFGDMAFSSVVGFDYSRCNSPIEIIFNFAFDLICYSENFDYLTLTPQYEIHSRSEDKVYYADFAFIASEIDFYNFKNENYNLVIECDGHDFHEKTKEQVAKNNERDYELKLQGYDILRFSGSQIFNKPFKCAIQAIQYIREKIGETDG